MHSHDQNELTASERVMLSELPREMSPGDLLEERVVVALRREGFFSGRGVRPRRGLSVAWKIAAALALFAGGVVTGRYVIAPDAPMSASLAPPSSIRAGDATRPSADPVPVNRRETVVAEREMWL